MYSLRMAQQSKWMSTPPLTSVARPAVTSQALLVFASTKREMRAVAAVWMKRKVCCSLKRGPTLAEKSLKMTLNAPFASRSPKL